MASTAPNILFVDDEPNIRLMLGMYLQDEGFTVTTAGTVPEALKLITEQNFDVLIADLNIGQAGDGFTVVSAMRRTQPKAVTFILTGYPAFETALQAIRLQVDDYITKPTDNETLSQRIREKLSEPKQEHYVQSKRVSQIVQENVPEITESWLNSIRGDPRLSAIKISEEARADHVPRVLEVAVEMVKGKAVSEAEASAARDHGEIRRAQGYTIPLILRETRLLHNAIASCIQAHLLSIEISYLIMDFVAIHNTVDLLMEESVEAFLQPARKLRAR